MPGRDISLDDVIEKNVSGGTRSTGPSVRKQIKGGCILDSTGVLSEIGCFTRSSLRHTEGSNRKSLEVEGRNGKRYKGEPRQNILQTGVTIFLIYLSNTPLFLLDSTVSPSGSLNRFPFLTQGSVHWGQFLNVGWDGALGRNDSTAHSPLL